MPRYVRVLETAVGTPRVSDALAEWIDVDDLIEIPESGGSSSLETPTGDADGENNEFTFTSPPILVFRNGVMESRLGLVDGNVFTFDTPPEEGDDIEGLV